MFMSIVDCESAKVVSTEHAYRNRLFLEAWSSIGNKNSGNNHKVIPTVYNGLCPIDNAKSL